MTLLRLRRTSSALSTSPQCSVTARPSSRAVWSAGSQVGQAPTAGLPDKSMPATPLCRSSCANSTVSNAAAPSEGQQQCHAVTWWDGRDGNCIAARTLPAVDGQQEPDGDDPRAVAATRAAQCHVHAWRRVHHAADVSSGALVHRMRGITRLPTLLPHTTAWSCPPPGCSVSNDGRGFQTADNVERVVKRRAFGVVRSSKYRTPSAAASDTTSAVMRVTTSWRVVSLWIMSNRAKQSAKVRWPGCQAGCQPPSARRHSHAQQRDLPLCVNTCALRCTCSSSEHCPASSLQGCAGESA